MLNFQNYMLFYEHLYDYPGNINSFLDTLGKQMHFIATDLNLARMDMEIHLPQLFCDRFPYSFNDTIFTTGDATDPVPVTTDFSTDHDGLITITAYAKNGANWTRENIKEIIFLNEQIMVLLTRSRLQSQLKKAEETDNITSVLNLAGIMHVGELLSIKKVLSRFSVLSLNINNFNFFNEKYGHLNGDLILRAYATSISDFIGKDGVIGRPGADDFTVLIATSHVEALLTFLKRFTLTVELDDMTKENIGITTKVGICGGTISSYFPQLIVNSKLALKQTDVLKGHFVERFVKKED